MCNSMLHKRERDKTESLQKMSFSDGNIIIPGDRQTAPIFLEKKA
jgi:hypothetical protein